MSRHWQLDLVVPQCHFASLDKNLWIWQQQHLYFAKYVACGTGEQGGWEGGGRAGTRALHLPLLAQTGLQLCNLIVG